MVVIGMLLLTSLVVGQEKPTPALRQSEEAERVSASQDLKIYDAVEAFWEARLVQEIPLSEEKARLVVEKMRTARNIRKGYNFRRYEIEKTLQQLLQAATPNQPDIVDSLQRLDALKTQYYQEMLNVEEDVHRTLSPEERAKYILFQRNFNKKLREVIANIRQQNLDPSQAPNLLLRKQMEESVIRKHP